MDVGADLSCGRIPRSPSEFIGSVPCAPAEIHINIMFISNYTPINRLAMF